MIEIRHVSKSFDQENVLNDINLNIKDGEIFGLVGRSGAGKSTLLRCINALETYDSGSIKVNGLEVKDLKGKDLRAFRRKVGMVFQQFSLTERDTVYENVALPMKCWKYEKNDIDAKVDSLLEIVGLHDKKHQKARNLSGGQKQRVAIARALTMDPSILLCDEATSALDPNTTKSIMDLLKEINHKLGVTIIIVTHEMSVVSYACDSMAVLDHTGVADSGDVTTIFKHPCPALIDLLGTHNTEFSQYTGTVIRIFSESNKKGENLISIITDDLSIDFEILRADVKEYRSGIYGEYILHMHSVSANRLLSYLKEKQIFYEVLHT